jgi:hypothetical protein
MEVRDPFRTWGLGLGFGVWGLGFWVCGLELRGSSFLLVFRISCLCLRVSVVGVRVPGSRFYLTPCIKYMVLESQLSHQTVHQLSYLVIVNNMSTILWGVGFLKLIDKSIVSDKIAGLRSRSVGAHDLPTLGRVGAYGLPTVGPMPLRISYRRAYVPKNGLL